MCLLQVRCAFSKNDKSCSTVSLEWGMLQASSKWSLKYLKFVQSFKNLNAKARWLTSTEDKSCSQIIRSGLCQGIFSEIFLKTRIDYLFFFTHFAQVGVFCGLVVSICSRVQHRVHILWCPHSAGALFFQQIRLSPLEQIIPEQRHQTAKVTCESLGAFFFFPMAWNISVFSNSFTFLCQIQHYSQQAWIEADDPSKLVAELTESAKGRPLFVPSNIKSQSCTRC